MASPWTAACTAVSILLAPGTAAAGVTALAVGPEGILGTWERSGGTAACAERVVVDSDGEIDLGAWATRGATFVELSVDLTVRAATSIHLVTGQTGSLCIRANDRELACHTPKPWDEDQGIARDTVDRDSAWTPVALAVGTTRLTLRYARPEVGAWRSLVRILDAHGTPGLGAARATLCELSAHEAELLAAQGLDVIEDRDIGDDGLVVRARLALTGGGIARAVVARVGTSSYAIAPEGGRFPTVHVVTADSRSSRASTLTAGARRIPLFGSLAADQRLAREAIALRHLLDAASAESEAPLAFRVDEMRRVIRERDLDARYRASLLRESAALRRALARGRDPFARPRGYVRMAFRSRLDGTTQPYELFVPPSYRHRSGEAWPLVITLHGFTGNAGDYFRNTFGLARGRESLVAHGRHGAVPSEGPMFVIAPTGRGQAMYRYAGEEDVLEALADVQRRFRIDAARTYITGGSMGGTGAASLPFRHPDLFAAAAALAGYHDQRVRADTHHDELAPWELFLRAERSDVDWAPNAQYLPMLLVRGTQDLPLAWTRSLAERLAQLSYPHELREPVAGHNVWTETYAGGAIFEYFARRRRPVDPTHLVFHTARERYPRSGWIEVRERAAPDRFARVDARIADERYLSVTTENAVALTLSPPPSRVPSGRCEVTIDGQTIAGAVPLSLRRAVSGRWSLDTAPASEAPRKRRGVSGPIRDVFHEPLLFVVGTGDPRQVWMNRFVAEHWARPRGWDVFYPVVDDHQVTDEQRRTHTLVLVGSPRSNRVWARYAAQLPVQVDDGTITVGGRCRHRGAGLGTVFVAANPEHREHSVLLVGGTSAFGTFWSTFLPDWLPDYVVFDAAIAPARRETAASGTGANFRAAGFFGMDFQLPRDAACNTGP